MIPIKLFYCLLPIGQTWCFPCSVKLALVPGWDILTFFGAKSHVVIQLFSCAPQRIRLLSEQRSLFWWIGISHVKDVVTRHNCYTQIFSTNREYLNHKAERVVWGFVVAADAEAVCSSYQVIRTWVLAKMKLDWTFACVVSPLHCETQCVFPCF